MPYEKSSIKPALTGFMEDWAGRKDTGLFSDTETGKYQAKQIVGCKFSCDAV